MLIVIEKFKVKPDQVSNFKAVLQKLVPIILMEDGCIQYDPHQDKMEENSFLIYENWESHPALVKYLGKNYLPIFKNSVNDMLIMQVEIILMTKI